MSTVTLPLIDGTRVVVPSSLNLITPYVVLEQQDWFEDEIKFVRKLLRPGQHVIDIGANYGLYTTCMAKAIGPTGRAWAFEPCASTANLLSRTVAENGFSQVTVVQSALSRLPGTARLSLQGFSELNELVRDGSRSAHSEEVTVTTLDECMQRYGWRDIDFVKMDAEGEEHNILQGGREFFASSSPLVVYEVKANHRLHLELIEGFAALGYQSYRLVQGLDVLVPFSAADGDVDPWLLNLFGCKPDRAARLAEAGLLVDAIPVLPDAPPEPYRVPIALSQRPYGSHMLARWSQRDHGEGADELADALSWFAFCEDPQQPPGLRFAALERSFHALRRLCARDPARLRLASLARVASAYGARMVALDALQRLGQAISTQNGTDASEPFLPPAARFDPIDPGPQLHNWMLGAVLEELERLSSYSSFYNGVECKPRLEAIVSLGFGSPEMRRRLQLVKRRHGV